MPPNETSKAESLAPTAVIPLQDWLKLLSSRGVDMRVAMALAAKIYKSHNTKDRLSKLDAKKLGTMISDKDAKRAVLNAIKGIASGQAPTKKRGRDSDLLEPLEAEKELLPKSLDFNEITDPEQLIPITLTVNRAPVKTAWAYTVALRMGFDPQEALSIAHVYVHLSSLKHALMLGNILNKEETKEAEDELKELPGYEENARNKKSNGNSGAGGAWWKGKGKEQEEDLSGIVGSSQPWVGIMRAKPVIERPDGTWRAIQKGVPVQPSMAYLYITKAFKDYTPQVMGCLKLLADSYSADELNRLGLHMYNAFKPDVIEWGQRGFLQCAKILDQMKGPIPDEAEQMAQNEAAPDDTEVNGTSQEKPIQTTIPPSSDDLPADVEDGDSILSDAPPLPEEDTADDQPPTKKRYTVEEYEAFLDAENQEGGYLSGGDIPNA